MMFEASALDSPAFQYVMQGKGRQIGLWTAAPESGTLDTACVTTARTLPCCAGGQVFGDATLKD